MTNHQRGEPFQQERRPNKQHSNDTIIPNSSPTSPLLNDHKARRIAKKRAREARIAIQKQCQQEERQRRNEQIQTRRLESQQHRNKVRLHGMTDSLIKVLTILHPHIDWTDPSHRRHARQLRPFVDSHHSEKRHATSGISHVTNIQPSNRMYQRLGLAKPSILLLLNDEEFVSQFEQEYKEHIPGFKKQRTNARKKQSEGPPILWRKLQSLKNGDNGGCSMKNWNGKHLLNLTVGKKKFMDMTPDEKVELLLQNNMI